MNYIFYYLLDIFNMLIKIFMIIKKMSQLMDKVWNFIYQKCPLYKKNLVNKEDLKNKTIDEIILMKENENSFLSYNIPVILWILWIMTFFDNLFWKIWFFLLLVIILVSVSVAFENKKQNIKIYNEILVKKLKSKNKFDEKYKNEILKYLKNIEHNFRN